jgi:hypothetical protein
MRGAAVRMIQQLAGLLVAGDDTALHASITPSDEAGIALLEARHRGGLEPSTTSARRVQTRWRRPSIACQAWLEIADLALEPIGC